MLRIKGRATGWFTPEFAESARNAPLGIHCGTRQEVPEWRTWLGSEMESISEIMFTAKGKKSVTCSYNGWRRMAVVEGVASGYWPPPAKRPSGLVSH